MTNIDTDMMQWARDNEDKREFHPWELVEIIIFALVILPFDALKNKIRSSFKRS